MTLPRERNFVHLHNHMEGSYSDSALPLEAALDRVAELGMPAFSLTDHGEMAMVRKFAAAADQRGIKPLVGFEAYFVEDAAENIRRRVNDRFHLTLLAANLTGYQNLLRMITASWRDNCLMQKMGLLDWKLLEAHSEGVLCLSGCLAGPVAWSFNKDDAASADRFYGRFSEIFGDRYYLEVFAHGMPEEDKAVAGIRELAVRYQRRAVLTNDCHYLRPEHWTLHDTLIKTRFGRPTDFSLPFHEYYIKGADEMRGLGFPDEFADATLEIADRVALSATEILAAASGSSSPSVRAFLGTRAPLGHDLAVEKAASVQSVPPQELRQLKRLTPAALQGQYPEVVKVAEGIERLPNKPGPDLERIVVLPGAGDLIPLRRSENVLFTMWDESDCVAAGARIEPIAEHPDFAPLARATAAYFAGLADYRRRKLDSARARFTEALGLQPEFLNARYQLGLVEYYSDNTDAARVHFEAILDQDPDFERLPHLQSYLGWCLFREREDDRARSCFEQSIADKYIPGSLLGLGLVLERQGDLDGARDVLLKLVERSPDFSRLNTAQRALERIMKVLDAA